MCRVVTVDKNLGCCPSVAAVVSGSALMVRSHNLDGLAGSVSYDATVPSACLLVVFCFCRPNAHLRWMVPLVAAAQYWVWRELLKPRLDADYKKEVGANGQEGQ